MLREEHHAIIEKALKLVELEKRPEITVAKQERSYSYLESNRVELSEQVLSNLHEFTYHVCHELLHLKLDTVEHDITFKARELCVLKAFGLCPLYTGQYADAIINQEDGSILWTKQLQA